MRSAAHSIAANIAIAGIAPLQKGKIYARMLESLVCGPLSQIDLSNRIDIDCPMEFPGAKIQASNAPTSLSFETRRETVLELTSETITSGPRSWQASYAIPIFSGLDWCEYALNLGSVGTPVQAGNGDRGDPACSNFFKDLCPSAYMFPGSFPG